MSAAHPIGVPLYIRDEVIVQSQQLLDPCSLRSGKRVRAEQLRYGACVDRSMALLIFAHFKSASLPGRLNVLDDVTSAGFYVPLLPACSRERPYGTRDLGTRQPDVLLTRSCRRWP